MVYKRRHQAQPPPPPDYPSPSWQHLSLDLLDTFPFHPSGNIPTTPLPAGARSPRDYPTGESHRGGEASLFSVLTSRHTETCVVGKWFSCGSRGRKKGGFVCDQMKVFNPTPLPSRGLSLIILSILHDAPQDLPDDNTVDYTDSFFVFSLSLFSRIIS